VLALGIDAMIEDDVSIGSSDAEDNMNMQLILMCCITIRTMYNAPEVREDPCLAVLTQLSLKHLDSPDLLTVVLGAIASTSRKARKNGEILGLASVQAVLRATDKCKDSGTMYGMCLYSLDSVTVTATATGLLFPGELK
jgi:hypothetical protein